jgi:hypothetical protein
MGHWGGAAVLAALVLAGLAGCGTPQTVELEWPASSNRFHPVRHTGQQPGAGERGKATTQRGN